MDDSKITVDQKEAILKAGEDVMKIAKEAAAKFDKAFMSLPDIDPDKAGVEGPGMFLMALDPHSEDTLGQLAGDSSQLTKAFYYLLEENPNFQAIMFTALRLHKIIDDSALAEFQARIMANKLSDMLRPKGDA